MSEPRGRARCIEDVPNYGEPGVELFAGDILERNEAGLTLLFHDFPDTFEPLDKVAREAKGRAQQQLAEEAEAWRQWARENPKLPSSFPHRRHEMVKLLTVKSCRRQDGVFYSEDDVIEVTNAEAVSLHAAFPGCFEGVGFNIEDESTPTGSLYKLFLEGKFKSAGEMK